MIPLLLLLLSVGGCCAHIVYSTSLAKAPPCSDRDGGGGGGGGLSTFLTGFVHLWYPPQLSVQLLHCSACYYFYLWVDSVPTLFILSNYL